MVQEQPPAPTEPKAPVPPPDARDRQQAPQPQPPSVLWPALISVCFTLLTSVFANFVGKGHWAILVAVLATAGLTIGLLCLYVLPTPRFVQALERKLQRVPAPADSTVAWRPIVLVLAGLAVLMLLLAFIFLQAPWQVLLTMVAILGVVVGPIALVSKSIATQFQPVMASIASSMASIALTLGLLGVGNGIVNPGTLAGTWQAGPWVMIQDDPHSNPLPDRLRWELAVKGDCLGQRCNYQVRARDANGRTLLGPNVLTPGEDGIYRGRGTYISDCVEAENPDIVTVASGYNDTVVYQLEPGPYGGLTRQQPTTIKIEITDTGSATAEAKARNCPDTLDVVRTTAKRS